MKWSEMTAQEWYDRRKEWLEKTAEEQRANPKKDCLVLMDYLDEIGLQYEHKPAIMLKDIDRCKGYIPDLVFHHPAADVIVVYLIYLKKGVQLHRKLVARHFFVGRKPQLIAQLIALKDAELDVGVADVGCQKHAITSMCVFFSFT